VTRAARVGAYYSWCLASRLWLDALHPGHSLVLRILSLAASERSVTRGTCCLVLGVFWARAWYSVLAGRGCSVTAATRLDEPDKPYMRLIDEGMALLLIYVGRAGVADGRITDFSLSGFWKSFSCLGILRVSAFLCARKPV